MVDYALHQILTSKQERNAEGWHAPRCVGRLLSGQAATISPSRLAAPLPHSVELSVSAGGVRVTDRYGLRAHR